MAKSQKSRDDDMLTAPASAQPQIAPATVASSAVGTPGEPGLSAVFAAGAISVESTAPDLAAAAANPTGSDGQAWLQIAARRALDDEQERQLDAIFDRILPADPERGVPGAVRAGASRFVSLLLARDANVYEEIPDWQKGYPAWLGALDAHVRQQHGKPLVDIGSAALDALVQGLEAGTVVGLDPAVDQKKAFKTFYRHCVQGCFADPRWGGNHERVMWRWIGYLHQAEEVK